MTRKLNIAIVGMGFGAEFIPIYQRHPNTNMYAICQRNKAHLDEVGDKFGIAARYTDFDELIADPNVDAVHINSPDRPARLDEHRCAARPASTWHRTVPMARTIEECRLVVEAQKQSGKKY